MADRLAASLQQSVLTALCFDRGFGALIAAQVSPEHFDTVYRDFAIRVLKYRKRFGHPPGINYIHDLAEQSSLGKDSSLVTKRLVPAIIAESEGLNAEYAATRVHDFVRRQTYKAALVEATDRYGRDDEALVEDLDRIFHRALQERQAGIDAGIFFDDPKALIAITEKREPVWLPLDIPYLDERGIGPIPKELLLYIAPKGSGKSWFCVHVGRRALMHKLKVAHISLEMEQEKVYRRYVQSWLAVARSPGKISKTKFKLDDEDVFESLFVRQVHPRMNLRDPDAFKWLRDKMRPWGVKLHNLVIKDFPSGHLTVDRLTGYLDYLQEVQKFVPNVLIIDYPDLMAVDKRNLRVDLGRTFVELRGIGAARNMAIIAPTQGQRKTIGASQVTSSHVAEDITKVHTADTVFSFSRTKPEEIYNVGRLTVAHARDNEGGAQLLLAQSYAVGQYVLQSTLVQRAYWEWLGKKMEGAEEEDDE